MNEEEFEALLRTRGAYYYRYVPRGEYRGPLSAKYTHAIAGDTGHKSARVHTSCVDLDDEQRLRLFERFMALMISKGGTRG